MIDILLPVLGRPQNAQPVVDSIIENTDSLHRIIFICSPTDDEQIEASRATGQETWIIGWASDRADYAKKINWAFGETSSEWVFQGADDIRFSKSWDTNALRHGARYSVIGTNDLHNPSVRRGVHSTHILFRRSYIEKYGGTFDGSGKVFTEAYDHQWIDNEFVLTAKRRGEWHFAKHAVVEHLHPLWEGAEWDPTYDKSFRGAKKDQALFVRRISQMERTPVR